jgi:hypothetical protein
MAGPRQPTLGFTNAKLLECMSRRNVYERVNQQVSHIQAATVARLCQWTDRGAAPARGMIDRRMIPIQRGRPTSRKDVVEGCSTLVGCPQGQDDAAYDELRR